MTQNLETKIDDLIHDIRYLKKSLDTMTNEYYTKGFSIDETAKRLQVHPNTVRNLIRSGKLKVKYVNGTQGKCTVPAFEIKNYLESKNNRDEE